jgi:hypothetical protein
VLLRRRLRTDPKLRSSSPILAKDIEFADRWDAALKARGFEPLIDRTDIYAFEEWWKRVEPTTLYVDECPTDERQHHEKHDA